MNNPNVHQADLRMSAVQTSLSGFVLVASRSLSAPGVSMWKPRWRSFTAIKTQKQICGSRPLEAYWHIHSDGEIVYFCVRFRKVQLIWRPWRTTGMRGRGSRWHLRGLKVSAVCAYVCMIAVVMCMILLNRGWTRWLSSSWRSTELFRADYSRSGCLGAPKQQFLFV